MIIENKNNKKINTSSDRGEPSGESFESLLFDRTFSTKVFNESLLRVENILLTKTIKKTI